MTITNPNEIILEEGKFYTNRRGNKIKLLHIGSDELITLINGEIQYINRSFDLTAHDISDYWQEPGTLITAYPALIHKGNGKIAVSEEIYESEAEARLQYGALFRRWPAGNTFYIFPAEFKKQ